jgi:hypothetical protein
MKLTLIHLNEYSICSSQLSLLKVFQVIKLFIVLMHLITMDPKLMFFIGF